MESIARAIMNTSNRTTQDRKQASSMKGNTVKITLKQLVLLAAMAAISLTTASCKKICEMARAPANNAKAKSSAKTTASGPSGALSSTGSRQLYKCQIVGMECLVNPKTNIRRQALTAADKIKVYQAPDASSQVAGEIGFFVPLFVFDVRPENVREDEVFQGKAEWFQVGFVPQKQHIEGWVRACDVACWDMRLGINSITRNDNSRQILLPVFAAKADAEDYVRTGNSSNCIATTKIGSSRKPMPWPVKEFAFFDYGGKRHELANIHFIGEVSKGAVLTDEYVIEGGSSAGAGLSEKATKLRESMKELKGIFVIDTTNSMQPCIDGVKKFIREVSEKMKQYFTGIEVSFRLVEYRDYDTVLYFDGPNGRVILKEHPSSNGFLRVNEFSAEIDSVEDATKPNYDWPEAVYDGLDAAIANSDWGGELTERVIILIGDDSPHPFGSPRNPKGFTPEGIIKACLSKDVKIFSILAPCRGPEVEVREHRARFTQLAAGTGGKLLTLSEARPDNVVKLIDSVLTLSKKVMNEHADDLKAIEERFPKEGSVNVGSSDIRERTDILELKRKFVEWLIKRGVSIEDIGIGKPMYSMGWIATEDASGAPLVEKRVYMAKPELWFLCSELNAIAGMLEAPENDPNENAKLGSITRGPREIGSTMYELSIINQEPAGTMKAYWDGLGVHSNALFNLTKSELMGLSQTEKLIMSAKLSKHFIPLIMKDLGDDSEVFVFNYKGIKFGWPANEHLP